MCTGKPKSPKPRVPAHGILPLIGLLSASGLQALLQGPPTFSQHKTAISLNVPLSKTPSLSPTLSLPEAVAARAEPRCKAMTAGTDEAGSERAESQDFAVLGSASSTRQHTRGRPESARTVVKSGAHGAWGGARCVGGARGGAKRS